jgi:hypothetical protein
LLCVIVKFLVRFSALRIIGIPVSNTDISALEFDF